MSYLSVNNLTVGYGKKNVIDGVSFEIEKGSLVGILGANGSGKTTLLKAMCGILPHNGSCTLDSTKLENLSAKEISKLISYIPQRSGISIDISVLDVVLMGFNTKLGLLQHPNSDMKKAALKALAEAGLSGKENMNYMHLSEGQKQLCILARTFVSDSKLFLLDEPESALDFNFRYKMLSLIKKRTVTENCSAVVALHDPTLALNYCDSLILLCDGTVIGKIEPEKDPTEKIEELLGKLYGSISLQICKNRNGVSQLVMLERTRYEGCN